MARAVGPRSAATASSSPPRSNHAPGAVKTSATRCSAGAKAPSMSSLKKTLVTQGMKLMGDPRVVKLMQDPRVMKAIMQMMAVPGKVQSFTHEQVERLAKSMALATEDEVKDLKRTVRRLEEELTRLKSRTEKAERGEKEERPSQRSVTSAARKKSPAAD